MSRVIPQHILEGWKRKRSGDELLDVIMAGSRSTDERLKVGCKMPHFHYYPVDSAHKCIPKDFLHGTNTFSVHRLSSQVKSHPSGCRSSLATHNSRLHVISEMMTSSLRNTNGMSCFFDNMATILHGQNGIELFLNVLGPEVSSTPLTLNAPQNTWKAC